MTRAEREALLDEFEAKVKRRERLEAQCAAETDPVMREHINMWIDEVSDQIGRLRADLAAMESSATLVDMGRGRNLSEFT